MKEPDSLRKEEQSYESEIRAKYPASQTFINHCSDLLHLRPASSSFQGIQYVGIFAKTNFKPFDILCEVRGSVISLQNLKSILKEEKVQRERLPLLLYLDSQRKWLITPKNLSFYFFTHPNLLTKISDQSQCPAPNCYIDRHFDSKLFLTTSQIVLEGSELILDRNSYFKYVLAGGAFLWT